MKSNQLVKWTLFLGLCGLVCTVAVPNGSSAGAPTMRMADVMSHSQQIETGYSRLTPKEKAAFDVWLTEFTIAAMGSGGASASTSGPTHSATSFKATIDGEFEGWTGDTVVVLTNGQIWKQESYTYNYSYSYMSTVLVYQDHGVWYMKVGGMNEAVQVRRLK